MTKGEAIKAAHALAKSENKPAAIFESRYGITVRSAYQAPPPNSGKLVMVVSVTGLERAYDPSWA